jgi:hypothetical protein
MQSGAGRRTPEQGLAAEMKLGCWDDIHQRQCLAALTPAVRMVSSSPENERVARYQWLYPNNFERLAAFSSMTLVG